MERQHLASVLLPFFLYMTITTPEKEEEVQMMYILYQLRGNAKKKWTHH